MFSRSRILTAIRARIAGKHPGCERSGPYSFGTLQECAPDIFCAASASPADVKLRRDAPSRPRPSRFVWGPDPSYDRGVTEQTQAVLATALRLTVEERAQLAADLLASLDGEPDDDVEAAWAVEIERRVRRLEEEGSRGRPWQEVFDGYRRQP